MVNGAGSELRVHGATGPVFGVAVEGSTANNLVLIGAGAKALITSGAKVVTEGVNISGVLIGGLGGPLASVVVDGIGSILDAGSLLVVGSHPIVTGQFGALGSAGELVARNGGVAQATTIYIGTDGLVKGNGGTLQGTTVHNHGIIAPGESPGTLTIQGDLVQAADGKLVIEIGGTTPGSLYDVLNVTGKLTLGRTLEVDLINGFTPGTNDVFDFLHVGSFAGSFANIILPQSLHLNFGPNGITALSAVPLPAAVWLLGTALGGLGFYRRRA